MRIKALMPYVQVFVLHALWVLCQNLCEILKSSLEQKSREIGHRLPR